MTRLFSHLAPQIARLFLAVFIALICAFLVIETTSADPGRSLATLLTGPLSSVRTFGNWIDDTAKLTLAALAFSLVFQVRQFALGVQGQVYVGALLATLVALSAIGGTPFALPLGALAAMTGGALFGLLPAIAKLRFNANEIVSSLMLNYIAYDVCNCLLRVYLVSPQSGLTATAPFIASAVYPRLVSGTRIDCGAIIALSSCVFTWFALYRTGWGLKVRTTGENARFARYCGINERAVAIAAMGLAGAIGGLLGAVFVQGVAFGKMAIGFEAGMSFEGILIAIVARNHPLAVPFVALAYCYLRQGAGLMAYRTDVPAEIIGLVQGVIILFVASQFRPPSWPRIPGLLGLKMWRRA